MGPEMQKIKVLVVDDKSNIRSMLAQQINGASDCEVVGEAENGQVAIDLARQFKPNVILMDIEMPVMDGIAATRVIAREQPRTRILILTYLVNPGFVSAAMGCGACGYIVRGSDTAMIVNDIRAAFSGRLVIDPKFIALAQQKLADLDIVHPVTGDEINANLLPQLTPREIEILNLIGAGLENAEILQKLAIRKSTLEHHIEHIFEKIGVHSREHAIVWARQHGFGAD
jgi:DNA-binding NarL/FixJ family response regulator